MAARGGGYLNSRKSGSPALRDDEDMRSGMEAGSYKFEDRYGRQNQTTDKGVGRD
jgi:hypothetical protein